jgi:hypothetical protein
VAKKGKKLLREVDFKIGKGKYPAISLLRHLGIDRIIVKNNNGIVEVRAEGHTRFEFSDKKTGPYTCDFWLANPLREVLLKDYIEARFWGQFGWGALFSHQNNVALKKEVNLEIKRLTEEFEENASNRLNGIVKKFKTKKTRCS